MSFMHTHENGRRTEEKINNKKNAGILESFAQTVFCQLSAAEWSNMGKIPREGRRRRKKKKEKGEEKTHPPKKHTHNKKKKNPASIKTPRQMVYTLNCWVI